ncbi:MAG: type I 3-dehydroquinate dehydratase [Prevotellaceae bacterium]|jgi:3-dehydroquinate dehydratase-1|nr:type I 3-dehydroquinate dehydratase [Prevotellaceae bacterium]
MICISIIEQNIEKCVEILEKCEMAELRFDKIQPKTEEISKLLQFKIPVIATCRKGIYNDCQRLKILTIAAENKATYMDIELESDKNYREKLIDIAHSNKCKIIISYHNFNETPDIATLKNIEEQAKTYNPDFIKIVTTAQKTEDNLQILSLYEKEKNLIAFAMGELGKHSRIESFKLGSPFIYAAYKREQKSADGQMTMDEIKKILQQ